MSRVMDPWRAVGSPAGPQKVLPGSGEWALHGLVSSRRLESRALARAEGGTLMSQAGESVARWVCALHPHVRRISVFCGPGGNGGDGLHAAARLALAGRKVSAVLAADPAALEGERSVALEAARRAGVFIETDPARQVPMDCELVLDALLGLGRPRPEGLVAAAAQTMVLSNIPRLAIDLPTGLDPNTGALWAGPVAPASATLSLLTLKPGQFTGHGRDVGGEIWLDRLEGVVAEGDTSDTASADALLTGAPALLRVLPQRRHASHKGCFGDVAVLGGSRGMTGALRLAAHAALAAGAGRVIAAPLDSACWLRDDLRPELIWRAGSEVTRDESVLDRATVVCGCGGGEDVAVVMPALLSRCARLVLDADALNRLAQDAQARRQLANRHPQGRRTILTPHPLEAARLLGCSVADVQADRLAAAARLASTFSCTVVLKGSGTVICSVNSVPAINASGNASLATAGSGDVLAGWIGGLWAQAAIARPTLSTVAPSSRSGDPAARASAFSGLPETIKPSLSALDADEQSLAHDVACAAVWLHGWAAETRLDSGMETARGERTTGATPVMPHALRALDLVESMRDGARLQASRSQA